MAGTAIGPTIALIGGTLLGMLSWSRSPEVGWSLPVLAISPPNARTVRLLVPSSGR